MTAIKPERVEELRKVLHDVHERERWFSFEEFRDLLAILDDYEKIKRTLSHQTNELENTKDRVRKLQAERDELKDVLLDQQADIASVIAQADSFAKIANEKEAKLARWRPVIEAVMGAELTTEFGTAPLGFGEEDAEAILRAALKLREL